MSYIIDYTKWKQQVSRLVENKTNKKMIGFLDEGNISEALFSKEERKARRKEKRKDKRSVAKSKTMGGNKYKIVRKKDNDPTQDTYIVKTRGKTKIWGEDGKITDEAWDFVKSTIDDSDRDYDNDSIEPILTDKKRRDRIEFTVKVKEEETVEDKEEDKEEEKEEVETKVKETTSIKLSANDEGSIAKGDASETLPSIRELLQATFGDIEGLAPLFEPYDSKKYIAGQTMTDQDVQLINSIRKGLGMKVSGKISNLFLEKVASEVKGKEETEETEETEEVEGSEAMDRETFDKKEEERKNILSKSESTLYKFNEFLAINEGWDPDAAVAYYKETYVKTEEPAAKAKSSGSGGAAATGFTKEQGDAFRQWANSTDELKAKYGPGSTYDLDPTGSHDNKFIRKTWAAAVSSGDHEGIDAISTADKAGTASAVKGPEAMAASNKLYNFWKDSSEDKFEKTIWAKYKGWDDREDLAMTNAYNPWIKKNLQPLIDKLDTANKDALNQAVEYTRISMTDKVGNVVRWKVHMGPDQKPGVMPKVRKFVAGGGSVANLTKTDSGYDWAIESDWFDI